MDWIDTSVDQQEVMAEMLTRQRKFSGPVHRADGLCCNDCGDPAIQGGAFCSPECRDDWQRREVTRG
jgi:hypothetical protein